jgi:hypothetical protein
MPKPVKSTPREDVVLVHGLTDDGKGYQVLRKRGDDLRFGAMRPLEEGKPIHGEVVRLKPREESVALYDVESQHAAPDTSADDADRTGPPKVTNARYRSGWDAIWGPRRPPPRDQLN